MKVIFACGGTAGHINPAIAIADTLKQRYPDVKILFVGNPNRMEADLVPRAGYDFAPVVVEGFLRKITPGNIIHNIKSVYYAVRAGGKVKKIISEFCPDIIVGTGGYVSGPVLRTGSKEGIKTLTHESNAYPGLTTKILLNYADKVLLAVEDTKEHLPESDKYVVTGNPVRPEILKTDRQKARENLLVKDKICVLSHGGSNGAEQINIAMAKAISLLQKSGNLHFIHSTGRFGVKLFAEKFDEYGGNVNTPDLDVREYIHKMPECLAAADIVISRAGAMSISEIQAMGKAAILIPSPNVAENHQYYNALALAKRNAAILIEEKDLDGAKLAELIAELAKDPKELENIGKNARSLAVIDGADKICDEIIKLYES